MAANSDSTSQPDQAPTDRPAVHEDLQPLHDFWAAHGKSIALGACVAALAVAGLRYYQHRSARRVQEAAAKFTTVRTAQDLEAMLTQYASTPVAPLVLARLAKVHYNAGDYDMAFTKYSQFLARFPKHPMARVAEVGRLHCMEAKGDWEEARKGYALFAESNTNHFLRTQALLGRARCLRLLGRQDDARIAYEDFVAQYPEKRWTTVAEEALTAIRKEQKAPRGVIGTNGMSRVVAPVPAAPVATNAATTTR